MIVNWLLWISSGYVPFRTSAVILTMERGREVESRVDSRAFITFQGPFKFKSITIGIILNLRHVVNIYQYLPERQPLEEMDSAGEANWPPALFTNP